ncbi:MAG TPA: hypothetical protein DCE23_00425 [Firmicutes bacterium]|nr:hypothetical protein [Bacillota bacterium]
MKKIILIILSFFIMLSSPKALELPVDITAEAAIVKNANTDEVLFTKNADEPVIIASLTKIMTAYTIINQVENLDQKVKITEEDLAGLWVYTLAGLKVDDVVTYRDLLYGLLLISGADCAQALALAVTNSVPDFVAMMNQNAEKLGLRHTHFADPAGGENENISTARELSILLNEALKNETFKKIFGTNYYTMSNGLHVVNYTQAYATFHGLDPYLLTGSKAGYTDDAGLLLASTATINNINYIVITCKSTLNQQLSTHVLDSYKIYDYLSSLSYVEYKVIETGTLLKKIPIINATTSDYYVLADQDISITIPNDKISEIHLDYHLSDYITPENKIGDNLGFIDIYVGNDLVKTYNIYLHDEIFSPERKSTTIIIIIILLIFLCLILLCINLLITPKKVKIKPQKSIKKT